MKLQYIILLIMIALLSCSCSSNTVSVATTPRTGQIVSYATDDDGELQRGQAWPGARFTDSGDGTVMDNLSGLTWVKEPHSLANNAGEHTWSSALSLCRELVFAGYSDWRLPNVRELCTMLDYSQTGPAIPKGNPFVGVPAHNYYWTSTTYAYKTNKAWAVDLIWGAAEYTGSKNNTYCVWPVRGGKQDTSASR